MTPKCEDAGLGIAESTRAPHVSADVDAPGCRACFNRTGLGAMNATCAALLSKACAHPRHASIPSNVYRWQSRAPLSKAVAPRRRNRASIIFWQKPKKLVMPAQQSHDLWPGAPHLPSIQGGGVERAICWPQRPPLDGIELGPSSAAPGGPLDTAMTMSQPVQVQVQVCKRWLKPCKR
jgi:hypothetical protein